MPCGEMVFYGRIYPVVMLYKHGGTPALQKLAKWPFVACLSDAWHQALQASGP